MAFNILLKLRFPDDVVPKYTTKLINSNGPPVKIHNLFLLKKLLIDINIFVYVGNFIPDAKKDDAILGKRKINKNIIIPIAITIKIVGYAKDDFTFDCKSVLDSKFSDNLVNTSSSVPDFSPAFTKLAVTTEKLSGCFSNTT